MPASKKTKQALIGATIIFDAYIDPEPNALDPDTINNFIDIVSLDGIDGVPVIPTLGDFLIYAKTTPQGGFKALSDNGTLAAAKTGGSALADGIAEGASFAGPPLAIKIVPSGVNVAAAYRVDITQLT